ncbi:hypothetical protein RQP53_24415 [Paucibacter sp. APW11]|uniref:Uncharacterized protein n=1 Tax=Roseateles aquae TaxID=3077235 RepID=A0ABU3PIT9_9BURK|nr:hypothetical protein [Paucibacter sp. APW11]MDT9002448.1 hypothetical protein [Paucibacter sp. APW11]
MNEGKPASFASVDEAMKEAAAFAVADAAAEGLVLDYSWSSVQQLEAAFDRLFDEKQQPGLLGRLIGKKPPASRRSTRYAYAYGGYLAEVVRRRHAGEWGRHSRMQPEQEKLTFTTGAGIEMWPHERIMKRALNGPEDNLYDYLCALDRMISERSHGA